MKNVFFLFLVIFAGTPTGCRTDRSSVPNTKVYLELDLRTNIELSIEGNCKSFTKSTTLNDYELGFGGILVVRGFNEYDFYGNAIEQFYAFDLCCPVELDRKVRVEVNEGEANIHAICPVCGTTYNIIYGTGNVESGAGKEPLKRYSTYFNGHTLKVIN